MSRGRYEDHDEEKSPLIEADVDNIALDIGIDPSSLADNALYLAVRRGAMSQVRDIITATENDPAKLVSMLCYEVQSNIPTVFHAIAQGGYADMAEHIAGRVATLSKADRHRVAIIIEKEDGTGLTPLQTATSYGHYRLATLYLSMGADPARNPEARGNASSSDVREAPIAHAVRTGDDAIFDLFATRLIIQNHKKTFSTQKEKLADVRLPENYVNTMGENLLHIAASSGRLSIAQKLEKLQELRKSPDAYTEYVNAQDQNGHTPLYTAALNGHREIVEYLLHLPEIIQDKPDLMGRPPLHAAASNNHTEVMALLTEHGNPSAEILQKRLNACDSSERTALHMAVNRGHVKAVEKLLELGADPSIQDKNNYTPLMLNSALRREREKHLQILMGSNYQPDVRFEEIDSLLGDKEGSLWRSAKEVLDSKEVKTNESAAIFKAIKQDIEEELKTDKLPDALLTRDDRGNTPLHLAAQGGFIEITNYIITAIKTLPQSTQQEILHTANDSGHPPLYYSARDNYALTSSALLNAGANPLQGITASENSISSSPFGAAVAMGDPFMVKRFIQQCGINRQIFPAVELIRYAALHGRERAAIELAQGIPDYFLEQDSVGQNAFHKAAFNGRTDVIRQMADQLVDKRQVHMPDKMGRTPLHFAATNGYVDTVATLIELGADVNQQEHNGRSALYMASYKGKSAVVKLLLNEDNKADKSLRTSEVIGNKTAEEAVAEKIIKLQAENAGIRKELRRMGRKNYHRKFVEEVLNREEEQFAACQTFLHENPSPQEPPISWQPNNTQWVRYGISTANATFGALAPILTAAGQKPEYTFAAQTAQSFFSVLNAGVKTYDTQLQNSKKEEEIRTKQQQIITPYMHLPENTVSWKAYAGNIAAHTALYGSMVYYRYYALEHSEEGKPDPQLALDLALASGAVTVGAFLINQTIEHVLKQESKVLADQSTQQQDGFERRLRWAYDPEALRYEPPAPEAWQAWATRRGHEVVASSQATLTQGAHWVQHNGREALTNSRERLTHSTSWLQQNALTPAREGLAHSAEWLSRRFTTAQIAPTEIGDLESGNLGQNQQVDTTSQGRKIKLSEVKEKGKYAESTTPQIYINTSKTPESRVTQVESDQQHKADRGKGTAIS